MNDLAALLNGSNIQKADDLCKCLCNLPDNENIKWKRNTTANQVVMRTDNYFFKVYSYREMEKYNSIIRHKLAEIYNSYGIDWQIVTLATETGYIDIERRPKLNVCEEWNESILRNYSHTLTKLEESLGFSEILNELKKSYPLLSKIKLIRNCANKPDDYAMYDGKIILLDDADWYIACIDNSSRVMHLVNPLVKLTLYGEQYVFVNLITGARSCLTIDKVYEFSDKFFFVRDVNVIKKSAELKNSMQSMLENNIKILTECNDVTDDDYLLYTYNSERKTYTCGADDDLTNFDSSVYNSISVQCNSNHIQDIYELYLEGKIGSIWINSDLVTDTDLLFRTLDLAKYIGIHPIDKYPSSGIHLYTKMNDSNDEWCSNLIEIGLNYPEITTVIDVELDNNFISRYLAHGFNEKEFEEKYHTTVIYSSCYVKGNKEEDFTVEAKSIYPSLPSRERFLYFIRKYTYENFGRSHKLLSNRYRINQNTKHFSEMDYEDENCLKFKCGHSKNRYSSYSDSDKCCMCDKIALGMEI